LRDGVLLLLRETPREIAPELRQQERNALLPPAPVTDGILHHDLIERASVLEPDGDRICDRALLRIEIVAGELRVLHAFDPRAQGIDARVAGDLILVVGGSEAA